MSLALHSRQHSHMQKHAGVSTPAHTHGACMHVRMHTHAHLHEGHVCCVLGAPLQGPWEALGGGPEGGAGGGGGVLREGEGELRTGEGMGWLG